MQAIQEVFLELDYEELEDALAARASRLKELQEQGWECKALNLYASSGHRVLLLQAQPPGAVMSLTERTERRPQRQLKQRRPRPDQEAAGAAEGERQKPIKLPKFESR
jgi:hypothetical protein